ncbi:NAD(P)H-binding protein [Sanguibacter hominis ATCC BAA-789]|uniref:NAD(P)H-binding protein n=1 Tax=Sanguibacter hominis ATCC BAA-789 TaxID=1312740 RepID=A0A9X5F936_9MICO|nr:NAD(P)H-binding protein [Sanguibacter hominis ATCC BAA-789]
MKICIIGGSQGTGAQLATHAIDAGHDVVVLSRRGTAPAGAGGSSVQLPRAMRGITMLALAKPLADHDEQEAAVTGSGFDWTIVRPSGLTDKPATGAWTALEVGQPGTLRGTIPRADLAAFTLNLLTDDAALGKAFGVSSR